MRSQELAYRNSLVSYQGFGQGDKIILCFHGYAEDSSAFSFLGNGSDHKFLAFDLPFHGTTKWNEGNNFTPEDLVQITKMVLEKEGSKGKVGLLGFSLGGRIALALYQEIPTMVSSITLLAPDGLKMNFWYWLSTKTLVGNKVFSLTMKHPGWFFGFLKAANKLGTVNASIYKFVQYYIGDKEVRDLLYKRWTSLRKITPQLKRIKKLIRKCKTPVKLVYGKHDRIILPVRGEKFIKGIEDLAKIQVIESGHQVLHEKHANDIVSILKSNET